MRLNSSYFLWLESVLFILVYNKSSNVDFLGRDFVGIKDVIGFVKNGCLIGVVLVIFLWIWDEDEMLKSY